MRLRFIENEIEDKSLKDLFEDIMFFTSFEPNEMFLQLLIGDDLIGFPGKDSDNVTVYGITLNDILLDITENIRTEEQKQKALNGIFYMQSIIERIKFK